MATRPEKVCRWKRGVRPDRYAEAALADLLGVPIEQVRAMGWPHWLRLALTDDQVLVTTPWTPAGALTALDHLGRPADMDRRAALFSGGVMAATLASWAAASPARAVLASDRTRVTTRSADLIDGRLAALRLLDDEIGSGQTYALASTERAMITEVLRTRSYNEDTGRRLFSAAAEASRICGWAAFDSGAIAEAERHYLGAARAAATADDPVVQANVLSFWAMARYSGGDTSGALAAVEHALTGARRTGSPRMIAMLHARAARAHAKAGDMPASLRSEGEAFEAYEHAGSPEEDPPCVYWVSRAELHSWAASNASDLGNPRRALTHYAAIASAEPDDAYPRSRALRLTRTADAQLALREVDAAVHSANQAVQTMGGVTSARSTTILTGLRVKLAAHQQVPAVRNFLERSS
ncbi:transcriptional regulator [Streptomyces cavernae]|uniref:transcriptional regulator n=1 Tax=Streptomyces cavernae TaxID=2259034 RepID=UPI000FEC04D9|nr:transcriptional regulator [Streptomyces cavernae]